MMASDKKNNTAYSGQSVTELSEITGLQLNVDSKTGQLKYAKDANGNPIVNTKDVLGCGCNIPIGSATARADLIAAIDNPQTVDISITPRSVTPVGGNQIGLSPNQIQSFVNGTAPELDKRTLGLGMTLLHELRHTGIGGSFTDPSPGSTSRGPVVDRINIYRAELSTNPTTEGWKQFGQRKQYYAIPSGKGAYIPFGIKGINNNGKIVNRTVKISF